jgi:hypothetical protein
VRSGAPYGGAALGLALSAALAVGWVQIGLAEQPAALMLAAAPQQNSGSQTPEGWVREFDRRRERLIDRLESRMDELRRRLERNHGPAKMMIASCG